VFLGIDEQATNKNKEINNKFFLKRITSKFIQEFS